MNIIEFLKEESKKFNAGYERVYERRNAWNAFEDEAVKQFELVCSEALEQNLFTNLYVDYSKRHEKKQKKPPSFITLSWCKHPTGEIDFRENTNKLVIESGCALHYSQCPSGEVAVIFYPFKSEASEPNKKYYLYKIFSSPKIITENELQKHIKIMFSYAHYSSFMGMSNFSDWYRMKWLQIRSQISKVWHSDWINFIFNQAQKVLENQIKKKVSDVGHNE
jgi:hypothetical protein